MHFATLVLVDKMEYQNNQAIVQAVYEILAPYDHNRKVTPYEIPCECKQADKKLQSLPDYHCKDCRGNIIADWPLDWKWDYWVIGGNYDGLLLDRKLHRSETEFYEDDQWLIHNCISTDQFIQKKDVFVPYAIVNKDNWLERGDRMEEQWRKEVFDVLKKHPNHWAVLCDLHC